MASKQENKITVTEDNLYLKDFQIEDIDVISYFQNLSESEDLEEKLLNLKIGKFVFKENLTIRMINHYLMKLIRVT